MRLVAFIVLFNVTCNVLLAQAPFFSWARQLKGNGEAVGLDIAVDHIGNVYTTGSFTGVYDFDPGAGSFLLEGDIGDCFVSKLDAAGSFVWAKQIRSCKIFSLTVDAEDNVYICGAFSGTVDFDPGPGNFYLTTSTAGGSAFIAKLSPSGSLSWAKKIANRNVAKGIKTDASNNVYVTGFFQGKVDFDPGQGVSYLTSNDWDNTFILKLTATGEFVWAGQLHSKDGSEGLSLSFDSADNVYTCGYFDGTFDMDPGPAVFNLTAAKEDMYVSKLDPSGNFVWGKQVRCLVPSLDQSAFVHIDVDPAGNVFITGFSRGPVDLDPGVTDYVLNNSVPFGFIAKWNSAGTFAWAKMINAAGYIHPEAISVSSPGMFFTTGSFSGSIDFDPGPQSINLTSPLSQDIYISKYDSSGNFVWAGQLNGTDTATSIANFVDSHNNIYTTGYFSGTVDMDPGAGNFILSAGLRSSGLWDAFVHKMSPCANPTTSVMNVTSCDKYVLNNYSYDSSGTYHQAVFNAAGCDSIITLHLTIDRADSSVLSVSACNAFTWNGHTYTATGIYRDTFTNTHGCDSIAKLQLTISHNSFSNINAVICAGQSMAGYLTAGIYVDTFHLSSGCDSTRTLSLAVDTICAAVAIPNAFSPNGDGLNDVFRPVIRGTIQQYHCIIYNRWGNKMFETRDYKSGWDGLYNGKLLPVGTYVYFIQIKQGGVERNYEGTVQVVR